MEPKPTSPAAHATTVSCSPRNGCYLCLAPNGSSITTSSLAEARFWYGAGYVVRLLTGRRP